MQVLFIEINKEVRHQLTALGAALTGIAADIFALVNFSKASFVFSVISCMSSSVGLLRLGSSSAKTSAGSRSVSFE